MLTPRTPVLTCGCAAVDAIILYILLRLRLAQSNMARFVHTPYTHPCVDLEEIDINQCTWTHSCLERVPSIRRWWHRYISGSGESKFEPKKQGHNPHAVDAACTEMVAHIIAVFGVHGGSLSSEMVQNAVMRQQPILYEFVIGHLFHRRWHEFISQYTDIFTLVSIKNDQSSNTEYRWRLYQSKHREQWEMVDTERTAA